MICRTCKGTGKVNLNSQTRYPRDEKEGVKTQKGPRLCRDCYGSGKVINKERRTT